MLEHTKAVIFDLDGTLVDSMWVWTAIDEDYIRKYHLNPPEDFHEAMEGMSYTETAQYFLKIFPELPLRSAHVRERWFRIRRQGIRPLFRILWRRSKKNGMICLWINIQKRSH